MGLGKEFLWGYDSRVLYDGGEDRESPFGIFEVFLNVILGY